MVKNKEDYKFKVVITDADFADFDLEREELEKINAKLEIHQCKSEQEIIEATRDADGLIVQYANINRNVIESLEKCKVISRYGVGVDTLDIQAATEHNICIVNVRDYCFDEVSTHTLALTLASIRKITLLNDSVKKGIWDVKIAKPIFSEKNKIFGLIGYGAIGKEVARKAQAFGFKVVSYDPFISASIMEESDVEKVELEDLIQTADVISLHLPLNDNTRNIINEKELKMMKETTFLINTSRGGLINEEALYRALTENWIAGAGLDVLEKEAFDPNYKLFKLDNLIITPHAAFYSEDSLKNLKRLAAIGVSQVLQEEVPTYLVNKEVLEKIKLNKQK